MPYVSGMVIALGLTWIFAWLVYRWFVQTGTTGQGFGSAFKTQTRAENAELDRRGRDDYRRATNFLRSGVPVAFAVVVVGVVVAVL